MADRVVVFPMPSKWVDEILAREIRDEGVDVEVPYFRRIVERMRARLDQTTIRVEFKVKAPPA